MDDKNTNREDETGKEILSGMGGIFEGVSSLLGRLSELAEKGQELKRTSQFQSPSGNDARASYGVSVKFASGGQQSSANRVEPIIKSSVVKATKPLQQRTPEDREAQVDVFEEPGYLSIVAELPGVMLENISIDFQDRIMNLVGTTPRVRFTKSIELSQVFGPDDVAVEMNNGVVEIRLAKKT